MDYVQSLVEGKIDFEGQRLTGTFRDYTLIGSAIISFLFGFLSQSLRTTFILLGFSTIVLCAVVVPPWSYYNRHPIKWLPVKVEGKKA
ncbi:microsomal signal peptidase 12 kDa subunit [Schizopora paradoxa]|uniref:Signal peptidase complex subunit 1 n=1 Tax=Schizopora paradoxa TaxID=27342 RepID=A0A0H2RKW1_9AGAM|nr:microsomal signal peptidase 12 kDa subunit [Schizopora paradoxa]